jgi:hypothetical protein
VEDREQNSGPQPVANDLHIGPKSSNRNRNLLIAAVAIAIVFLCVISFSLAGALGYVLLTRDNKVVIPPTPTAVLSVRPTPTPLVEGSTPGARSTPAPATQAAPVESPFVTEQQLAEEIIPTRDIRDLAIRLKPDVEDIPLVVNTETPDYEIGDKLEFWAANVDDNRHFKITAELIYKTDVAYVWVETGQDYNREQIIASVDQFSESAYNKEREFFGSEWNPGVDNDPRLHILHATDLGDSIAGYYSSADEFSKLANEFSNEKEMFYISLSWLNRSQDFTYYETVLAHEFQHMIHWANDRNEETWVNEGLSELAQEVAGYPPDTGFASLFSTVPDTQLNTWSDDPSGNGEHYGNAYLFMAYFLQRFGPEMTKAVVANEANGPKGFTEALAAAGYDLTFDDIFADWLVANYVDSPDALGQQGAYGYQQLSVPRPTTEKTYRRYPVDRRRSTVHNYAADYIVLQGSGNVTVDFQGQAETRLADVTPFSGQYMWWSNRADDSDSRLTRRFDFTSIPQNHPLEMEVKMWWDIEDDYDYGYVLVSRDGQQWDILPGQRTTTEDPSGNSFGPGYTRESAPEGSKTAEWVTERIDLSDYAGEEVWIRFEYVTDDAVNYPGWFIDDISIPSIGYTTDFESGPDGWESEGWLRTDNRLHQGWILQLLELDKDNLVNLQRIPVDAGGHATIPIDGLGGDREAVLIISARAPVTTEEARYEYQIDKR